MFAIAFSVMIASTAKAIGTNPVENYLPVVKYNEGIYTALPITTTMGLTSASITNTGAMTVGTTLAVTGATTLSSSLTATAGATSLATTSVEGFTQGGNACTLTDANGGAVTFTAGQLLDCSYFKMAASGAGQEVIQLTFPATSSLSTVIPNTGDSRRWVYDAADLAAATTTTVTAGTGMDLIAVTTNDDVIDGAEFAEIICWRQPDTDITCLTSELLHAD